jgi:acetylornithine deacetylase/succinyl-diaminopimelate desuccinylase-like protein
VEQGAHKLKHVLPGPSRYITGMRLLCLLPLAALACFAQNPAAEAARKWRQTHERVILSEFVRLLSIPNIATDTPNIRRNADLVSQMYEKRGVHTRLLETEGAPPVVYGEIATAGAKRTILFYAHYDGQPLDPREWKSDPFQPVLRNSRDIPFPEPGTSIDPEWRLYARSASDDKAPILAIAAALDAIADARIPIRSNIKFVFEGEEEAGSQHLDKILAANRDLLKADVWLICDGPVHQSRRPQIVFGARGVETLDITIYGPTRELHSGHYGNWAPNPAMMLARLLTSMKDDDGRVLVEHFYDGIEPLSDTEKRALADAPDAGPDLKRELLLGHTEGAGKTLLELLNYPSLNIRGMASSRTGDRASNVIPTTATVSIDMRLVKGVDHRDTSNRVIEHIKKQGYFIVEQDPSPAVLIAHSKVAKVMVHAGGYNASRTSMDLPISRDVIRTIESALGPCIKLPTMGGSVPLVMIERILGAPTITTPIANHDNNQHSFNENIRLANLWTGIEMLAALLTM